MAEKKKVPALAIILAKAHRSKMGKDVKDVEENEDPMDDIEGEMHLRAFCDALGVHMSPAAIKEACEALEMWHEWAHRDMEKEGLEPGEGEEGNEEEGKY